jgi:hypothetical protein
MPADAPDAKRPMLPLLRQRERHEVVMDRIVARYREIREDQERERWIKSRQLPPTLEELEAKIDWSAQPRRRRRR